jgi:hypothetical protein
MHFRWSLICILAVVGVQRASADRIQTFNSLETAVVDGWSIFSPVQEFSADVSSTSRALGDSGAGEAVVSVVPGEFSLGAYFADTHLGRRFDFDDTFSFTGKIAVENFGTDDYMQVVIGFFNSRAVRNLERNFAFVGFSVGGGHTFTPPRMGVSFGLDWGGGAATAHLSSFLSPTTISLQYMPNGDFGADGKITAQFGPHSISSNVTIFDSLDASSFDAFGIFAYRSIFAWTSDVTVVVDDLQYTTFIPEPALAPMLLTMAIALAAGYRCDRPQL